uniref:Gamma-secretase subunit PEN-2 n=1 Tax=Aedes albopictus TaxID=7160 RepID=A0A023EG38_AEDAL
MDLNRVPNERKLYLCKWYFKGNIFQISNFVGIPISHSIFDYFLPSVGFALLPFVWAINTVWFFTEAFRKPAYDEQKEIRKYVIFSAIGSIIWFTLILTWVMTFQLKRTEWGDFADSISFIIPLGRA